MSYTCQVKSLDIYDENKWFDIYGLDDTIVNSIKYIDACYYITSNTGLKKSNNLYDWKTLYSGNIKYINYVSGFYFYMDGLNEISSRKLVLMIDSLNKVILSYNMIDFTEYNIDLFNGRTINGLTVYNNKFYVCGSNGFIASSDDGIHWEQININTNISLNSICSSDAGIYICGNNGLILTSETGDIFDVYDLGTTDNLIGILNSSLGYNIIWSKKNIFKSDFNTITVVGSMESNEDIIDVSISSKGAIFLIHANGLIEYTDDSDSLYLQEYATLESGNRIFINDTVLYVYGVNKYKTYTDEGTAGLYQILLEKSDYVNEVIVKQIVVSCYSTDEDEFIGQDGTVNRGMSSISLRILGNNYDYNLICPDSEILGGENKFILTKPLILKEGEKIEFMSIFPKVCATIYYVLGD